MLNDYKDSQFLAYSIFKNEIKNNMLSHAYLIDDNDSGESLNIVKSFIKAILCDYDHTEIDKCGCQSCRLIDNDSYPEIKIINPDGMYIKKGQLLELQQEFSRAPVYGKKRIYIICECEKMRVEAANAILKFLEEPNNDIIAFLITNSFDNVISTIVSRCQIIKLNNSKNNIKENEFVDFSINFINELEKNGIGCILNEKELWFNVFDSKDRENVVVVLDNMITMYYDIMKLFISSDFNLYYDKFRDDYYKIVDRNNINSLIDKIHWLIDARDSIRFNVNINLLVDKIILKVGGCNEHSRC